MNGKKITIIGGGHGTSVILSGLADSGFDLSAILSMADDGGSTGRLRSELGVSAVGDIRQCLVATATKAKEAELFSYRFETGELSGHSLGNLILSAGELKTGSLEKSIAVAKELLGVSADVIPSTEDKCDLSLSLGDIKTDGVYKIGKTDFAGKRPDLSLQPPAKLSDSAANAIDSADLIVIAPGNFYCSIIPALLVEGMAERIAKSPAKVLFICNLVNRKEQTDGFSPADYVSETYRLATRLKIDLLLYNTAQIADDCLREGERPVKAADRVEAPYELLGRDIADDQVAPNVAADKIAAMRSLARHDKIKLAGVIKELMSNA